MSLFGRVVLYRLYKKFKESIWGVYSFLSIKPRTLSKVTGFVGQSIFLSSTLIQDGTFNCVCYFSGILIIIFD